MSLYKYILPFILLCRMVLGDASVQAQEQEAGGWASIQITQPLSHGWSVGTRGEWRQRDQMNQLDLAFLRVMVGYRMTDWLSGELATDHMWRPSVQQNRLLCSLTASWHLDAFTFLLRQRFVHAHDRDAHRSSQVMRTRSTLSYRIGTSRWSPYIGIEGYYWNRWQMTHTFAGTQLKLGSHNKIDLFYVCNIKPSPAPVIHSLGVGYYYTF